MENKPEIPKWDREPDPKAFKRILLGAMVFLFFYGVFLIWKNYYNGDSELLRRQELPVPTYYDSSAKKTQQ